MLKDTKPRFQKRMKRLEVAAADTFCMCVQTCLNSLLCENYRNQDGFLTHQHIYASRCLSVIAGMQASTILTKVWNPSQGGLSTLKASSK